MRSCGRARWAAVIAGLALVLGGCSFDPLALPLPGGADVGDDPYEVVIEFRDVLDLVPQSAVRVDDIAVGRVTDIELNGWTAKVTVLVNRDAELPADAEATIRQSSLLGEKFVSLSAPEGGGSGRLDDGDTIGLERSGRNPEVEEVLGAASLLFNGGGLDKANTIVKELNNVVDGNEVQIKSLLRTSNEFLSRIDQNKEGLLTALEKVDHLAVTANAQRDAITTALDELPPALMVLNDQRDELVQLTTALEQLGVTATGVIAETRADTVANLQALQPILANLALSGEDLVANLSTLVTFPFPDSAVGGSLAAAQALCPVPGTTVELADTPSACGGDYMNLSVNVDLSFDALQMLLQPYTSTIGGGMPEASLPDTDTDTGADGAAANPVDEFLGLLTGDGGTSGEPSQASGQDATAGPNLLPGLCGLLGTCRAAVAGESSLARLLLPEGVTR